MRRTIGFKTAMATTAGGPPQMDYFSPINEQPIFHSRDAQKSMSKTSTASFPLAPSKQSLTNNVQSAPDPSDFFEAPQVEIQKFDRKFSKTALRQYKYPKVELERHKSKVEEYNRKSNLRGSTAAGSTQASGLSP